MASDTQQSLIITSDKDLGQSVRDELEAKGRHTILTNSVGPARGLLKRGHIDLLVLDEESFPKVASHLEDVLPELSEEIPLLLIATQGGAQVEAVKTVTPNAVLGDPLNIQEFRQTLSLLEGKRLKEKSIHIIGRSEAIQQIRATIVQIAPTSVSVLITGKSGVGKDVVAQAIHGQSPRRDKPFIRVNCGAIPENLLESELFGHEKGAFTDARFQREGLFEAADKGTIFLDEIGEMSRSAQVRLLRVLEALEVTRLGSTQAIPIDVRVIAATNLDLRRAVVEGDFRQDLYHRLQVVEINVPPLHTRPEDIPLLVDHFIQQTSEAHNTPPVAFNPDALNLLQRYRWPGNVRELINLIERLTILSVSRNISAPDLAGYLENLEPELFEGGSTNLPVHLGKTPEESQRDLLYWAILEVARDIKELKAYLMNNHTSAQPLAVFQPQVSPLDPGTDVEYAESSQLPTEIRSLRTIEREAIKRALDVTGGHRKQAAKLLEMAERTLYRKIQQYDL